MGFASRVNKKQRKGRFLPQVKYAELEPITIFKITRAQRVKTEYGPAIVIDLDNEFSLFVPKRTFKTFEGEDGEADFQELKQLIQQNKVGYQKTADGIGDFVDL